MNDERVIHLIELKVKELLIAYSAHSYTAQQKKRSIGSHALKLIVLDIIHNQLKSRDSCSLRDIYYQVCPTFTVTPRITNEIVREISCELAVPRNILRIIPASRGYAAGRFCFRGERFGYAFEEISGAFDCLEPCANSVGKFPNVISIPGDFSADDLSNITGKYVLVIEKDAIFQRIAHHKYPCHTCTALEQDVLDSAATCFSTLWEKLDLLCVTGCGFPDEATQRFVQCLVERFNMIPLGLVDYNPYGIRILTTYRYSQLIPLDSMIGEKRQKTETPTINIRWLGLHGRDIFRKYIDIDECQEDMLKYPLPLMKLSCRDEGVLRGLLTDPQVPSQWKEDIEKYMTTFKAELQALYSLGPSEGEVASCIPQENPSKKKESSTVLLLKYIENQILGHCYL